MQVFTKTKMTKKIAVTAAKTTKVYPRLCPRCGHSFPRFDEQGKHNFIAIMDKSGDMEIICMACRMQDFRKYGK